MAKRSHGTKSYLGAPELFDASVDDWTAFVQRFKHSFLANGVTDAEPKLHLFLSLVGTNIFQLLSNLTAPQEPGEFTYAQVIEKLTAHYKPKPLKIAEHFCFYKRNQQQGERATDYVAELRRLAVNCKFGKFLDEALYDCLVCGIRDEAAQHRLLAEADLNLTKALILAQSMERA